MDRVSTQDFGKLFQSQPDRSESLLGSLALLGAGALIGAAVALLFAPKAGSELRHDVGDQLRAAGACDVITDMRALKRAIIDLRGW